MTLDIFSFTTLWSRSKQLENKIGEIECIDVNNDSISSSNSFSIRPNDLYIGTTDGFIHKFSLRGNNSTEYEYDCIDSLNLGTSKPVVKIKVIILSLHRIITLSDNLLQIINSDNLQFISNIKLKNILTFTVPNKIIQGASIDMCTSTKRNKLQIYRLDRTNIHLIYEISVQVPLISIAMDEHGILACSETDYFSYIPSTNTDRRSINSLQTIYTLQNSNISACFTNITLGEYLLNGPNIGIPTTLQGTSERPPIMFIKQPNNFLYSHPYLLVLIKDYIHIYSYLDNQLKQEIPLKNCQNLLNLFQENRNRILINNTDNIYLFESLSIEEQIDHLLNIYRLQEALILAESTCLSIEKHSTNSLIISTKKRIGFIEFHAMNVTHALNLFDEIHLDYHEIMKEIPNFLPLNSPWPEFDENTKNQYTQWLTGFCDYLIKRSTEFSYQIDYYSSLLKAYLILKPRKMIIEFLETNALHISIELTTLLFHFHLYHGAAILYSAHNKHEQTINIWKKIILKEYSNDETFPGISIIEKYILEKNIDRLIEFSMAKWLLEQNEEEFAIKIFINKYQTESIIDPFCSDSVINVLRSYPTALKNYLEQAVFKLMIQTEEVHTMLMNIYLDDVLSNENNEYNRLKLQEFLVKSNSYRIQSVFHRINQLNHLKYEIALLHGKMNNIEQAFQILVHELEDFQYAENYCMILSYEKSSNERKIIAHILFKVFLNSLEKYSDKITDAILRLLCNNQIEFDFIEILQLLPSTWSISLIENILLRAIRTYSSIQRSTKLELSLINLQNEKLNIKLTKLKSTKIFINEYRRCKYCLHQFYDSSCIIYPDGSQFHVHCANKLNQK